MLCMGEALSLADIMQNNPIDQVGEQWLAAAATLLHQQGDTEVAIVATDVIAVDLSLWESNEYEPDAYRVGVQHQAVPRRGKPRGGTPRRARREDEGRSRKVRRQLPREARAAVDIRANVRGRRLIARG